MSVNIVGWKFSLTTYYLLYIRNPSTAWTQVADTFIMCTSTALFQFLGLLYIMFLDRDLEGCPILMTGIDSLRLVES